MMRVFKAMKTSFVFSALLLGSALSGSAQSHLMVAQHGTLNIVDNGAFMVLSLPISAFNALDKDNDGNVTMIEFNQQRAVIVAAIKEHVVLRDAVGPLALEGILLSPEVPHDSGTEFVTQLTVMGRFSLNQPTSPMEFSIGLYGVHDDEQRMEITGTRMTHEQVNILVLTPENSSGTIFPALAVN